MSESSVYRSYRFRLLPRKGQHRRLKDALEHSRQLYNAALQERIEAYRRAGLSITRNDQCKALTQLRADGIWAEYPVSLQRWPLVKVDLAFKAFFGRLKRAEKPGFPRFKGHDWFKSFGFTDKAGWRVEGERLLIKGIGCVRIHMHRPLPSKPVSCSVKRVGSHWFVSLVCEMEIAPPAQTGSQIGVDLGISSYAALSSGELIGNPKFGRQHQNEVRRLARALARRKRGSKNRIKAKARLARSHERAAAARRTFLHQTAARLVRKYALIAVEDLNVKGLARSALARDVNDAAWGTFIQLLTEKAERAGRSIVKVDPRQTSQTCPECGTVEAKSLSQRMHNCACGCVLDRDVAAAQVILHRAVVGPAPLNVAGCSKRAA